MKSKTLLGGLEMLSACQGVQAVAWFCPVLLGCAVCHGASSVIG